MKTTIELPDALLAEARRVARREGTTLKALIERGLRRGVEPRASARVFSLRDASIGGKGLQPGITGWESIVDLAYRGRGA
jgi:putative antitoxin of VapBC-like toxin-antitoxin system